MADIPDSARAQKIKLSNSRKKFKELQELKKKRNISEKHQSLEVTNENCNANQTPAESLTSSTHSSVNDNVESISQSNTLNNENQLPNYFNNNNYGNLQHPVMFFDNLSGDMTGQVSTESSNVFDYLNSSSPQTTYLQNMVSNVVETPRAEVPLVSNYSLFSQQNQPSFLAETQQILHPHQDSLSIDDPEIKRNEILEINRQAESNTQNITDFCDILSANSEETGIQNSHNVRNEPICTNIDVSLSSIENLQQLSNQMAQAIEPEFGQYSNSITDLEKRNLELASLLEQEKLKSEQQKLLLQELQAKLAQSQNDRKLQDEQCQLQITSEVSKLKEELQCHIQTVGLLVAEKTELSATISQLELTCKQKNNECEELQARLKTSRSRVADLEHEVNTLKAEKLRNVNAEKEHSETFLKVKIECDDLREQKEELVQNLLEVREKLKKVMEENLNLQQQLQETSSKLSLAELKIQQISNSEQVNVGGEVESLIQEKFELEKQVSNLNAMLKTITKERDESSVQYQQYAQQLNAQISSFSTRIENLQQENESLAIQDQNRIKHISELERQLQNLQNEQVTFATNRTSVDASLKNELENTRELCIQLQMEKTTADENFTKTLNEKEMLMKELAAKNDSLSQLETMIEQLRGNQPDSVKLLATMESDKIAAARAVQQNKHLKEEMESMQEVFLKLDNDKVELTEKLSLEQADKKELLEKLQKVELQVQRLTDAIEIKDRELFSLRNSTAELSKQVLQHEQLADRLRHYEAQDNSSHILQFELQEAKQTIVKLTNEINILKNKMNNTITNSSENASTVLEDAEDEQTQGNYKKVSSQDLTFEKADLIDGDNNNLSDRTSHECSSLDKDAAMKCLEEKCKKTMQEIADLTEEKLRLEHLVLQLQGETETIGEYVALYQHQRMVLKQKAIEKDQQLKQLANDREQMKTKLEKLNELIKRLVLEKGQVPTELLQDHKRLTSQSDHFCEEHSKLHEEMNKICDSDSIEGHTNEKSETAERIIELLSEIKNSNLIQNTEDFHHCAWCSGKLITV